MPVQVALTSAFWTHPVMCLVTPPPPQVYPSPVLEQGSSGSGWHLS